MRIKWWVVVSMVALLKPTTAQVIYSLSKYPVPKSLIETSGLAVRDTIVYSHNDGGNPPMLYAMSRKGKLIDSIRIKGVVNIDWEDISFDKGKFYISETGNNFHTRKDLRIYTITDSVVERVTGLRYGKQKLFPPTMVNHDFDCEALLVRNDTAHLFSKTWAQPYHGITYQYVLPLNSSNENVLTPVDSFITGKNHFLDGSITGCDVSPTKKYFALTSCNYLYLFFNFKGNNFLRGNYAVFRYESTSQREAIAFTTDSTFYISDERWANLIGGNLYQYNVAPFIDGRITYTVPEMTKFAVRETNKNEYRAILQSTWTTDSLEVELVGYQGETIYKGFAKRQIKEGFSIDIKKPATIPAYVRVYHKKRLVYCVRW